MHHSVLTWKTKQKQQRMKISGHSRPKTFRAGDPSRLRVISELATLGPCAITKTEIFTCSCSTRPILAYVTLYHSDIGMFSVYSSWKLLLFLAFKSRSRPVCHYRYKIEISSQDWYNCFISHRWTARLLHWGLYGIYSPVLWHNLSAGTFSYPDYDMKGYMKNTALLHLWYLWSLSVSQS